MPGVIPRLTRTAGLRGLNRAKGTRTTVPGTGPRGVTPEQQVQRLLRTLVLVRSSVTGVDHVFWYAERDRLRGNAQIAHFGLLTTALRPKPAARALACYLGR